MQDVIESYIQETAEEIVAAAPALPEPQTAVCRFDDAPIYRRDDGEWLHYSNFKGDLFHEPEPKAALPEVAPTELPPLVTQGSIIPEDLVRVYLQASEESLTLELIERIACRERQLRGALSQLAAAKGGGETAEDAFRRGFFEGVQAQWIQPNRVPPVPPYTPPDNKGDGTQHDSSTCRMNNCPACQQESNIEGIR